MLVRRNPSDLFGIWYTGINLRSLITVAQYSSQPSAPEGGAKNPSKGTSMKFLVLAWGAQPWAYAGS
jgi:hypothetical protein